MQIYLAVKIPAVISKRDLIYLQFLPLAEEKENYQIYPKSELIYYLCRESQGCSHTESKP